MTDNVLSETLPLLVCEKNAILLTCVLYACVCVQLLRHDPSRRLPLLYVMNHEWIKCHVAAAPAPNSLAAQGLTNLPPPQQQQQNK